MDSRFKIGDSVELDFGLAGRLKGGVVKEIHFTAGRVYYDVSVDVGTKTSEKSEWEVCFTRLLHLDSAVVVRSDEVVGIKRNSYYASDKTDEVMQELKKVIENWEPPS